MWRISIKKLWNTQEGFNAIKVLIPGLIFLLIFTSIAFAYYRAKYTESAHGNNTYGVNRSSISSFGYVWGNCAHCHEQHALIGGTEPTPPAAGDAEEFLLFYSNNPSSQNNNFCFQCHKSSSTIQSVTNYTYSKNFGGGSQTFTNIYDAFNPTGTYASSHNLSDVLSHAVGRSIGFTSNNNACVVCHDPHIAQRQHPVNLYEGSGERWGVNTSIRRPLDYQSNPSNLWGDEDAATSGLNERFRDYTNRYKAPCYQGGACNSTTGPFEPANNATSDGSNLPNYYNFCMNNCHTRNNVSSTEHGTLTQIDWTNTGDEHGNYHSNDAAMGNLIDPYGNNETTNWVLSCTDCHEPHGSNNEWLLRTCVNGKDNIVYEFSGDWWDFCTACHVLTGATNMYHQDRPSSYTPKCPTCHYHGGAGGAF